MLVLLGTVHWVCAMGKMRMFFDLLRWIVIIAISNCVSGCGGNDAGLSDGTAAVPSGALVNYHSNGAKKLEEFYKGDLRHGLSTTWDENGSIVEQRRYADGKLVETRFENGRKVGGE